MSIKVNKSAIKRIKNDCKRLKMLLWKLGDNFPALGDGNWVIEIG